MFNNVLNVQGSDTTGDDIGTNAGYNKFIIAGLGPGMYFLALHHLFHILS